VDSLERAWRRSVVATQDDVRCEALLSQLREHGTSQVPTLVQQRRPKCSDMEALTRDPNLKYVPAFIQSYWPDVIESTRGADLESERALCRLRTAQVGMMARWGVPLLAGSDAGWPWVIWGFGLHEELQLLVEAGLTPLQALQTATLNPARYPWCQRLARDSRHRQAGRPGTTGRESVGRYRKHKTHPCSRRRRSLIPACRP